MEQRELNRFFMNRVIIAIISSILLLGVSGCKSVDPNPELKDKIYLDIQSELEDQKKNLDISYSFLKMAYEEENSACRLYYDLI